MTRENTMRRKKVPENEIMRLYVCMYIYIYMKSLSHVTIDHSLPGSSVHGIFQARILEWVTISFSKSWDWKDLKWTLFSNQRQVYIPDPLANSKNELDILVRGAVWRV